MNANHEFTEQDQLQNDYNHPSFREKLSHLAAATILFVGAAAGFEAAEEVIYPSNAYADTLGYPWPTDSQAPCQFGTSGGTQCTNPNNAHDKYDWGVNSGGTFYQYRNGYEYRNCTDYVQWKESTIGVSVPGNWHDGGNWYSAAPANERSTIPAAWDAAVEPGSPGHVAFVETVNSIAANPLDDNITISEYNEHGNGTGDMRTGTASSMGFTEFVDFGVHPSTQPNPNAAIGRLLLINGNNAAFAKDNISTGGWHSLTGNSDALQINAAGTHIALINSGGVAYGADVSSTNLANNNPGLQPLNVPEDPNTTGGVKKIVVDDKGNMMAINNCSAAYGWRNIAGQLSWQAITGCGDALDVEVGNGRMALINSCGAAYYADTGYNNLTNVLGCGDAKAIAVGEAGRLMIINGANTAYVRNDANNGWVSKSAVGDARQIAIGKNRIMVVTAAGSALAADIGQDINASMTRVLSDGNATAIAVGGGERMEVITGGGEAYASDTIVQDGAWTYQAGPGDAHAVAVG